MALNSVSLIFDQFYPLCSYVDLQQKWLAVGYATGVRLIENVQDIEEHTNTERVTLKTIVRDEENKNFCMACGVEQIQIVERGGAQTLAVVTDGRNTRYAAHNVYVYDIEQDTVVREILLPQTCTRILKFMLSRDEQSLIVVYEDCFILYEVVNNAKLARAVRFFDCTTAAVHLAVDALSGGWRIAFLESERHGIVKIIHTAGAQIALHYASNSARAFPTDAVIQSFKQRAEQVPVARIALSDDAQFLAVAQTDGISVKIYEAATGCFLRKLYRGLVTAKVVSLQFERSGVSAPAALFLLTHKDGDASLKLKIYDLKHQPLPNGEEFVEEVLLNNTYNYIDHYAEPHIFVTKSNDLLHLIFRPSYKTRAKPLADKDKRLCLRYALKNYVFTQKQSAQVKNPEEINEWGIRNSA